MHPLEFDLVNDLFAIQIPYLDKIIRTIGVYLALVILLRIMGKRLMAQLNTLDLVVVLLLSNVVQNAIIGPDNSLIGGLAGALVLLMFNAGFDRLTDKYPGLRSLIQGRRTRLVNEGEVDDKAMHRLGLTHHELRTALRQQGADDVSEVKTADIEPGGQVTTTLKRGEQAASYDELQRAVDALRDEIRALRPQQ